eukprot:350868-Chlamydomonas_euryale.AAC.6
MAYSTRHGRSSVLHAGAGACMQHTTVKTKVVSKDSGLLSGGLLGGLRLAARCISGMLPVQPT